MKISVLNTKVICSNPNSLHNYFGWPTVARLGDGRLAMVASGFRLRHVCPFGKVVACYSDDEGESWTRPLPVIDTPLDDRDGGITPFGENGYLVTTFNNNARVQKQYNPNCPYANAYLDNFVTEEMTEKYLGSLFAVTEDGGKTFGPIHKAPVSSPHGPLLMPDGSFIYVGRYFSKEDAKEYPIACYRIWKDGRCEFLSEIESTWANYHEPHAILLPNGKILVHIRVESRDPIVFTLYQAVSEDGGLHFSKPRQISGDVSGAPAHLYQAGDGTLICSYGYRGTYPHGVISPPEGYRPEKEAYGIRVMFSRDDGETWEYDHVLCDNAPTADLGYPSTVELKDGRFLTAYYSHETKNGPAVVYQTVWSLER